ncbi:hypothetical protein WG909_03880 [Peptostreptococcaceae bacterium AGR-M142]
MIHDSIMKSYFVDFENKNIIFKLKIKNVNQELIFKNFFGYKFDNATYSNIILDIEEIEIERFIQRKKEYINEIYGLGFPIELPKEYADMKNIEKEERLQLFLKDNKYKIYTIYASLGLCGFVISKNIELKNEEY